MIRLLRFVNRFLGASDPVQNASLTPFSARMELSHPPEQKDHAPGLR